MENIQLKEKVREMKNSYAKEWRKKNPEKAKAIYERYWIKRAKMELEKGE